MFNLLTKVSLSSWDEAWYGVISKNIFKTGDFINLSFNSRPFYDHPPFVFWLQAICFKLFGVGEFSVRFPSFVLGIGTLIVLYLLGSQVFSKRVGLFSAFTLVIAPWFLTRSLSGNLDVPLTFLFVLSFYLATKTVKNIKYLIPLSIALGFLFLTKSLVPFTIIPAIIYILWKKVKIKSLLIPFIIFIFITAPWFLINYISNSDLIHKYLSIGYPGNKTDTNIWQNILLTKTYLHNGIGNIFIYSFYSLPICLLFYRKKYFPIFLFIATFLFPFAFSNKGHIWHLIPLYPFWILSFYGTLDYFLTKFKYLKKIGLIIVAMTFIFISYYDAKRNWYEIIKVSAYKSDIEILATKSIEYDLPLYLDDDAVPETLFYSDRDYIERTIGGGSLKNIFEDKKEFLLITKDWRLNEENINPKDYTLIAKDRDKVLILKK